MAFFEPTPGPSAAADAEALLQVEPSAAESPAPRQRCGRGRVAAAAGVATMLAGSAAYAAVRGEGGASNAASAPISGSILSEAMEKFQLSGRRPSHPAEHRQAEEGRRRTVIEKDLSKLVRRSIPRSAQPAVGQAVDHFASNLFDDVMKTSDLEAELTADEQAAFKARFLKKMESQGKGTRNFSGPLQNYVEIAGEALESQKPVMTKAFAASLNKAQLGFTAEMRDWMLDESKEMYQARLGRKPIPEEFIKEHQQREASRPRARDLPRVPAAFDTRTKWPECAEVIERIHNQGQCGSCWAFSATGVIDSRICIKSGGEYSGDLAMVSRGFATSCSVDYDGCQGGWEMNVYDYIDSHQGLPTERCKPYFGEGEGTDHFDETGAAPECPTECDATYPRPIAQDWFKPTGMSNYRFIHHPNDLQMEEIKASLFSEGPLNMAFFASHAFMSYSGGIFGMDCGNQPNHAVQVMGWGVNYIHAINSWGPYWGDQGYMKFAYCVPTDYTIPGSISSNSWPLPIPDGTLTTSTTVEDEPNPETSQCHTDSAGCVSSPQWPENYGNNGHCLISPDGFGRIQVESFQTEQGYDILTIDGVQYSGTNGPDGIRPQSNIVWSADYSVNAPGWKICPSSERNLCPTDAHGCAHSPSHPGTYPDGDSCTVPSTFGKIDVKEFNTEGGYDFLRVNGQAYSGTQGPHGILPETDIVWESDGSVGKTGWRICPMTGEHSQCNTDAQGCVTSPNYPEPYHNSGYCVIDKSFGKIRVESFATERGYDHLTVNGRLYHGTQGPTGVTPTTDIVWSSDESVPASGWKICPESP